MRKGSLPRSIAWALPEPVGYDFAPDGLTETAIDALIAEVATEVTSMRPRPGWLSTDQAETRRARHKTRQAVRFLATAFQAADYVGTPEGEAA
jgi:hypothetical protein